MNNPTRPHLLKIWPEPFEALLSGLKPYEVRVFDRPYNVGDMLILNEWNPETKEYTGREAVRYISSITAPGTWGLPEKIGVLGISKWNREQKEKADSDIRELYLTLWTRDDNRSNKEHWQRLRQKLNEAGIKV